MKFLFFKILSLKQTAWNYFVLGFKLFFLNLFHPNYSLWFPKIVRNMHFFCLRVDRATNQPTRQHAAAAWNACMLCFQNITVEQKEFWRPTKSDLTMKNSIKARDVVQQKSRSPWLQKSSWLSETENWSN